MTANKPLDLPLEYRFDVAKAAQNLATLSETEPEAVIVVTLAELGADGMGAESDIYLTAASAAALLAMVNEDQRLTSGDRDLVTLRVTRREAPRQTGNEDSWGEDFTP